LTVASELKLVLRPSDGIHAPHAISALKNFLDVVRKQVESLRQSTEGAWSGNSYQLNPSHAFTSPAMDEVFRVTKRIATVDVAVLLTGETGVGKEVLAKAIHDQSPRAKAPFVPFNCSAIPREMLESQLFGYRKGAFTGALEAFSGVIRSAEPGTLFLDEVGDLPLDLQPKLLRFLEANEVHPLGEPRPIHVNVRVIAATNADLTTRIRDHQFREDLYYRLNTIQIDIPPLRQRTEEIPHLAQTLLAAHCEEFRKGRIRLSEETVERLTGYSWPGNIRELSNEMRRIAALAEPDAVVPPALLSGRIGAGSRPRRSGVPRPDAVAASVEQPLPDAVSTLEKSMIARALQMTDGRVDDAARLLGISRKGLFLKRKRYGLS
jgi:DNA-binding NtrC family response regulator